MHRQHFQPTLQGAVVVFAHVFEFLDQIIPIQMGKVARAYGAGLLLEPSVKVDFVEAVGGVAHAEGNIYAGERYFPNYDKVPSLMEDLVDCVCRTMQQNLSITQALHLSFDLHFQFVSIHLFYDGNGRTARLLINYIQHYYNLPLAVILQQARALFSGFDRQSLLG